MSYSPVNAITLKTMGVLIKSCLANQITDLDSGLHVRGLGPTPFSKVSVFVYPHENEAFPKVFVFGSLLFQRRFRKSPFFGGNDSTHSSFTCKRKTKTDKKRTRFPTKTRACGRALKLLTPMMAFSSVIVTCFARSTAAATCC